MYAITEALILATIAVITFTVLNKEYLFGWAAHNWKFYLFLAGIPLLLIILDKQVVSMFMTSGIVIGIFTGNYMGNLIKVFNEAKIVEGMGAEEVWRLRHHPGFKIWIGVILLSIVIGFAKEIVHQKRAQIGN